MRYLIWRIKHIHSHYITLRRGRTAYCGKCNAPFQLNK